MKQKLIDFLNVFIDLQKALVMLLLILIGVTFRIENLISGGDLVDLLKNTVIAFFAVKGTEHIVATVQSYYANKNAPSSDSDGDSTVVSVDPPTAEGTKK